jgi:hypothetical protein
MAAGTQLDDRGIAILTTALIMVLGAAGGQYLGSDSGVDV